MKHHIHLLCFSYALFIVSFLKLNVALFTFLGKYILQREAYIQLKSFSEPVSPKCWFLGFLKTTLKEMGEYIDGD